MSSISITQAQINSAVGDFITLITGIPAVVGQVNRVPSFLGDFAEMWPLSRPRLSTNLETPADSKFTAAIAGTLMTVSALDPNPNLNAPISIGSIIFGVGVAVNTVVVAPPGTGTGGIGTYTISPSQSIGAPQTMAAGTIQVEEDVEVVMQVDVHGPNSAENASILNALFRDGYAADQLEPLGVSPFYADDPRQVPFITAAKEYETRWTVDLHMQVNLIVSIPMQFADGIVLTVANVDVTQPPH
jgi:hypothetical protein